MAPGRHLLGNSRHRAGLRVALAAATLAALCPAGSAPAQTAPVPTAAQAPPPQPLGPEVPLSVGTLETDPLTGRMSLPANRMPAPASRLLSVDPADHSPEARLLTHLVATGRASGLAGVVYDNRDRGHSRLPPTMFPALDRTAYGPVLHEHGLDFGPAGAFRLPAITFGNSSTAVTNWPQARSLARMLMLDPHGAWTAWEDYSANAIYIYPEHRDDDAWDLIPAAWPYVLTSQGSSGSDQPFMRAVAMILAAFRPDTRARLEADGLVAPTVQMVLRRAQTGVKSRADYLSGAAHPSAFSHGAVNLMAMILRAQSLKPDEIPPVVRLSVLSEDFGRDSGLLGRPERLFDTPSAIARLWRGPAWQHVMQISAANTVDPNGRPLHFDWVLLRGDPAAVKIEPLDPSGSRARITLNWQEPRLAPAGFTAEADAAHMPAGDGNGGKGPMSSRVDIGIFADNGATLSAPAFVSVDFPATQLRTYAPGPDGQMRLAQTDYDGNARKVGYGYWLWWSAPWRDIYHYDAKGALAGWTRETTRAGGPAPEEFRADGQPAAGGKVRYELSRPGADLVEKRQ